MPKYPLTLELPEEGTINLDQRRAVLALKQVKQNNGSVRPSAAWVDLLPVLDRIGLVVEGSLERTTLPEEVVINNTAFHLWVKVKKGGVFSDLLRKKVMGALQRHLDWIGPVYRKPNTESAGSAACLFPHVIVIRPSFRNKKDPVVFSKTLKSLGLVEVRKKSAYLGDFRYFSIATPRRRNAYQLKDIILKRLPNEVESAHYEIMPMESPLAFTPNDPNYFFQWNMDQIEAPRAWDINRGSSATVVAVIDSGCDLGHADLDFSGSGINTSSMGGDGSPTQYSSGALKEHGTNVAGVIAANIDNSLGSAGLAGQCRILPIACPTFTDMEVASAIRYASAEGARIINMSFATAGISFWSGPIPSAIEDAESGGAVLCGATGNGDSEGLVRPAAHPLVMACGGSNRSDERWRFVSPSGVVRGSNYGDSVERGESIGVSVVSPAEDIPTTDITGVAGKVTVPSPAGDYDRYFWMTSAATPHVSGLAALLFSQYSSLTPGQVKRIIERTADKVGSDPYTDVEGYPNGTRNPKMGYGRLNAFKALSLADVMIRDWAGDSGLEPSTPPRGNFYSHSDIVIRPTDDGVFLPDDYDASSRATRSQENFLYVRVVNQGPHVARDVSVDTRITIPRTEFVYPADWTTTGAMHIQPTALDAPIATMAVGDSAIFRFRISVEQVETMFGWTERRWHPCVLAVVNASNDHAFNSATSTGGALIMRRNNLAQRNLSVIGVPEGEMRSMPFMAGSESSGDELFDLVIRIDRLSANDAVYLSFDTDTTFPSLPRQGDQDGFGRCSGQGNWKFIDRTRIETDLCGCRAVLTFEKGSEVDFCHPAPRIVSVKGGKIEAREGVERIRITDTTMVVRYHKASFRAIPLLLQAEIANKLQVDIAQRSLEGKVVGGVVAQFVKA